jgi:hypothetical protein
LRTIRASVPWRTSGFSGIREAPFGFQQEYATFPFGKQ